MASDKTIILVTGANNGIGYETVAALSAASAKFHVLLGSRSLEKGHKALEELRAARGNSLQGPISVIQLDVTDRNSTNAAKKQIEDQFGRLDVLINNAGILIIEPRDQLDILRETFETNVFGQMILTESLEPLLQKSSNPYIIYVSSEQGTITARLDPEYKFRNIRGDVYRMSKAALNMLAACHRFNYAEWGCKVAAFNPGWCITNLTGEKGREMRIKGGARDPKEPAAALVDIVLGKRDVDLEKNGMVDLEGGVLPW
ncbi:putative short chain dehydrogenase/reductase [Daldinia eschscholtzii]|nr:putative short chain dehydrogenase/reductase [Daldinia eschscholtzii]